MSDGLTIENKRDADARDKVIFSFNSVDIKSSTASKSREGRSSSSWREADKVVGVRGSGNREPGSMSSRETEMPW